MLVHGLRRAAEMEEVAITLDDLGVEPLMTRGTNTRQRALGGFGIPAPAGLAGKTAEFEGARGTARPQTALVPTRQSPRRRANGARDKGARRQSGKRPTHN